MMKLKDMIRCSVCDFLPHKSVRQIIEEQNTRTVWLPGRNGLPKKYVYGRSRESHCSTTIGIPSPASVRIANRKRTRRSFYDILQNVVTIRGAMGDFAKCARD